MSEINNPKDQKALKYTSDLQQFGLSIQHYTSLEAQSQNPLIATSSIGSSPNNFAILGFEELIDEDDLSYFRLIEKVKKDDLKFPLSKIMFSHTHPHFLATCDIELNIYNLESESETNVQLKFKDTLKVNDDESDSEFPAPLTSFDWNKCNLSLLAASSYDTTCTIWDLNSNKILTRLIAHDKEVFDIGFLDGEHIFVSAGGDGELRLFDLRDLENSQIMFDSKDGAALTRLCVNPKDQNYIAALSIDKPYFYLIDLRDVSSPVGIIQSHTSVVNTVQWSDLDKNRLCTGGDDKKIYMWDINKINTNKPILEYSHPDSEINNIDWKEGILVMNCLNETRVIST